MSPDNPTPTIEDCILNGVDYTVVTIPVGTDQDEIVRALDAFERATGVAERPSSVAFILDAMSKAATSARGTRPAWAHFAPTKLAATTQGGAA
tara:strand:+ start:116 stop:394 length:279 start_codon:yes stop_codon:yes gene_type:complete